MPENKEIDWMCATCGHEFKVGRKQLMMGTELRCPRCKARVGPDTRIVNPPGNQPVEPL